MSPNCYIELFSWVGKNAPPPPPCEIGLSAQINIINTPDEIARKAREISATKDILREFKTQFVPPRTATFSHNQLKKLKFKGTHFILQTFKFIKEETTTGKGTTHVAFKMIYTLPIKPCNIEQLDIKKRGITFRASALWQKALVKLIVSVPGIVSIPFLVSCVQ